MKAIEFKSKLSKTKILIPKEIQPELQNAVEKNVRVMILFDDSDDHDNLTFKQATTEQFLKGYADSDSIYDNY